MAFRKVGFYISGYVYLEDMMKFDDKLRQRLSLLSWIRRACQSCIHPAQIIIELMHSSYLKVGRAWNC